MQQFFIRLKINIFIGHAILFKLMSKGIERMGLQLASVIHDHYYVFHHRFLTFLTMNSFSKTKVQTKEQGMESF